MQNRIFNLITCLLLLAAIVAVCFEKRFENEVKVTVARQVVRQSDIRQQRESTPEVLQAADVDVQPMKQSAARWQIAGFTAVALAILAWGVAMWRRENSRWVRVPVVVLFVLYVGMELMLV